MRRFEVQLSTKDKDSRAVVLETLAALGIGFEGLKAAFGSPFTKKLWN